MILGAYEWSAMLSARIRIAHKEPSVGRCRSYFRCEESLLLSSDLGKEALRASGD